ncbi:MAG TPA: RES family NAD+ phosphorylase [Acetobacteraceae bacterium]|nr:RES family NAD+ phosphorylase [Acetobacteraceae bacterium]
MSGIRSARDNRLLDALENLPAATGEVTAWCVVRDGREPLRCSAVGGRWDDGTFEVLYTSTRADGAVAEMYFHLARGQPVIPSLVRYRLFELRITLSSCLRFASLTELASLGLQTASFGQLSYTERVQEYPRTQEIAEVAHFIGRDGMIVPSARAEWPNVIVFCDPAGPDAVEVAKDHDLIDWDVWRKTPLGF